MVNFIEMIIPTRKKNVGNFSVLRSLPISKKRNIGPFVFWDHMGPHQFNPGESSDVAAHPHIGLSTLTYLLAGAGFHKDSLGNQQIILPGDVNWMTAGRGIVHSERAPKEYKEKGFLMHGIQIWVALPKKFEEIDPTFQHCPSQSLPNIQNDGIHLKIIAGNFNGLKSPVNTYSPLFLLELKINEGKTFILPPEYLERAIYLLNGNIQIGLESFHKLEMIVLKSGHEVKIIAKESSHFFILGGDPLENPVFMWWNFVASSKDLLKKAKQNWKNQKFPKIETETEFIPLPDD
jgi:redox-sensitive bicupin YhaK (pirin superfamily)